MNAIRYFRFRTANDHYFNTLMLAHRLLIEFCISYVEILRCFAFFFLQCPLVTGRLLWLSIFSFKPSHTTQSIKSYFGTHCSTFFTDTKPISMVFCEYEKRPVTKFFFLDVSSIIKAPSFSTRYSLVDFGLLCKNIPF